MNDSEVKKKIQENLVQCRIESGLTQTDVGNLVGKTKTAVASWEQGKSLPDADTLARLAKYYGKTLSYMYGEEKNSFPQNWLQWFGPSSEPPKDIKQLLEDFTALTHDQQLTVLALIHSMNTKEN